MIFRRIFFENKDEIKLFGINVNSVYLLSIWVWLFELLLRFSREKEWEKE